MGGEEIVQRGRWGPPGNLPEHLEPLGVLVEHRVDHMHDCGRGRSLRRPAGGEKMRPANDTVRRSWVRTKTHATCHGTLPAHAARRRLRGSPREDVHDGRAHTSIDLGRCVLRRAERGALGAPMVGLANPARGDHTPWRPSRRASGRHVVAVRMATRQRGLPAGAAMRSGQEIHAHRALKAARRCAAAPARGGTRTDPRLPHLISAGKRVGFLWR